MLREFLRLQLPGFMSCNAFFSKFVLGSMLLKFAIGGKSSTSALPNNPVASLHDVSQDIVVTLYLLSMFDVFSSS